MTASTSAVTLRGIPQCHGENVESTVRTRSTSESGTVKISSVTSSRTASGPRRSASIAERESVATGTRASDLNAAARRGTENCLAMLSGRTFRTAGARKAASSCAVRPHRELRRPGSQVAAQRIQTHAQQEKTSRPPPTQLPANSSTLTTNRTRMPALPWARTAIPIHSATVI
ncbi:hypothetical protein TCDM_12917 [Trypanosoma cruzi Dm28c]|uniref:Uncharacterized protein n=1 Tax=Trypanosoma cruzi Dm28c TaxID=1416333 RepID=V5A4C8_TRYCR|nr:hypothetical protein TCDM_12917 [Trypanosoma cruzi Dm28c]